MLLADRFDADFLDGFAEAVFDEGCFGSLGGFDSFGFDALDVFAELLVVPSLFVLPLLFFVVFGSFSALVFFFFFPFINTFSPVSWLSCS